MKKFLYTISCLVCAAASMVLPTSCNDDPDSEHYYSFDGQMMSEYLQEREQYSLFSQVVIRADLMDLLSTYGHYTCFCPNDSAMQLFMQAKGWSTIDDLTDADCDTIARTHLVNVMYSTFEMKDGVLATQNMNKRPIEITHGLDNNQNSVVILNGEAIVLFESQNDSVENGIMQPIDKVLESNTNTLPDLMATNPTISIYCEALSKTGLASQMIRYKDDSYVDTEVFYDYITGSNIHEAATPPDDHLYGYTAFVVPDSVLEAKYGITDLKGLYELACKIYDNISPSDDPDGLWRTDNSDESHSFDNLSDPKNPLYRFMAYHLLNRNVQGWNFLTVRDDFGTITNMMNPTDWYPTFLTSAMLKVEHLTATKWVGTETAVGGRYLNRRTDDLYTGDKAIRGVQVANTSTDKEYKHIALNGIYFYIDDVLKFDSDVQNKVDNCRIRMDFSTVFPEVMTNDMRMNGDRTKDDDNVSTSYDHTFKYGRNYYFPDGYLDGVSVGGNGYFIYRRPRQGYWSLHGDEFICQGNYDVSFRLPPVPFEGDWQIRLGYAAMTIRGIAQIYFGTSDPVTGAVTYVPQGIPLDMTRTLEHSSILGTDFKTYTTMSDDEKTEDRKILKNLGFYRGANGGYRTGGSDQQHFSDIANTLRIVLCTAHLKPGQDYYLRVRAVSSKQGNNNEVMLDYLELVPKSVYGVTDEGAQEDDL